MSGLVWTVAVWGLTLMLVNPGGVRSVFRGGRLAVSRTQFAILLVLVGTHSFAVSSSAGEVLRNPLAIERVIRGGLTTAALLVITPLILHQLRLHAPRRIRGMAPLTFYVFVAGLSVLYSVAPIVSAGKVFELAAGLAIIWATLLDSDPQAELRRNIRFVILLEASLVATAIVGFFALPASFAASRGLSAFLFSDTMNAPYAHSNSLSASGGLLAAYALAMFLSGPSGPDRRRDLALFFMGTAGVVLASGRQGVIIWLASVAVLLFVHRRRTFFLLIAPAGAALVALYSDALFVLFARGNVGNLSTLTGRLIFWQAAMDSWSLHPWTGFGFGAGGRFVALSGIDRSSVSHLHSGYMEALVGVGIIGMLPLAYAVIRVSVWSFRRLKRSRETAFAILIVPLLLHTSVSNGFAAWLTADFLLLGFLVALSDLETAAHPRERLELTAATGRAVSPGSGGL